MTPSELRVLFGCLWAAGGCLVAIILGGRPERKAGRLMATCWIATTAAQFLTHRLFEPVLVGDFAYGLGLLLLAGRYDRMWIWAMIVLQAAVFFIHAALFQDQKPPGRTCLVLNNVIAFSEPLVLVAAALASRLRRRPPAGWRKPAIGLGETLARIN